MSRSHLRRALPRARDVGHRAFYPIIPVRRRCNGIRATSGDAVATAEECDEESATDDSGVEKPSAHHDPQSE